VDVVVAAGDIGVGVSGRNWLLDSFPRYLPMVYVPGNKEEVANYFVWRQKGWMRNSVSMLAQANFSHKELQVKGQAAMHDLLHTKGINWAHLEPHWKNGAFLIKGELGAWESMNNYDVTVNRMIIELLLEPKEG
jgi:hypothetical protein